MWLTKVFFSSGYIVIPETRPLTPLWNDLINNLWAKSIRAYAIFKDQCYSIYGLELLICMLLTIILVWKSERNRFKDINELIKLKRAQGN